MATVSTIGHRWSPLVADGHHWLPSVHLGQILTPGPIAMSTRTIAGVLDSYLVVAPGIARSVESVVPVYQAAWSADIGDHRRRRIFGRYSSSWEPEATLARSAAYFNELIVHFRTVSWLLRLLLRCGVVSWVTNVLERDRAQS